jgi:carbon storage regulator
MLVLSRQRDETIMIGDDIEITVVDIRGDKVRLGICAPTRIAVHRKEVYDAIRTENERAARMDGAELDALAQTIKPGPAAGGVGQDQRHSSPVAEKAAEHPKRNPSEQTPTTETPRPAGTSRATLSLNHGGLPWLGSTRIRFEHDRAVQPRRSSNDDLEVRLQRLATGLRINRGGDDPAGLIISERIGTDIRGVEQAIKNGERASSVIATTEAALAEVNDLLNSDQGARRRGRQHGRQLEGGTRREPAPDRLGHPVDHADQQHRLLRRAQAAGREHGLRHERRSRRRGHHQGPDLRRQRSSGRRSSRSRSTCITSAQKGTLYLHPDTPLQR